MFAIPRRYQVPNSTEQQQQQPGVSASVDEPGEDSEGNYDDNIQGDQDWPSPRNAAALYLNGCLYEPELAGLEFLMEEEFPEVVWPYMRVPSWRAAYVDGVRRILCRLAKGLAPSPNCTTEGMALHKIIEGNRDYWADSFGPLISTLKGLPSSIADGDFDLVKERAFADEEEFVVLKLYTHPEIINDSCEDWFIFVNIHPKDWFKPFQLDKVANHVM